MNKCAKCNLEHDTKIECAAHAEALKKAATAAAPPPAPAPAPAATAPAAAAPAPATKAAAKDHAEPDGDECPDPAAHAAAKADPSTSTSTQDHRPPADSGHAEVIQHGNMAVIHKASHSYCSMCGKKFSEPQDSPHHKECDAMQRAQMADELAKRGDVQALVKLMREESSAQKSIIDQQNTELAGLKKSNGELSESLKGLTKRLETVEAQPVGGGPRKTETPQGVVPVDRADAGPALTEEQAEAALTKAMEAAPDRMTKDAISRMLSRISYNKTLMAKANGGK